MFEDTDQLDADDDEESFVPVEDMDFCDDMDD